MKSEIVFRKATIHDAALIHKLAVEIWSEHYPGIISQQQIDYMLELMYSIPVLESQILSGHEFTLAYVGEKPAGYIAIHQEAADNKWFLDKLYLKKEYRNLKLGEKLYHATEEKLRRQGVEELSLFVNRENYKSINFYFKCGFVIQSVINKPIGNGFYMNDFIMVKRFPK